MSVSSGTLPTALRARRRMTLAAVLLEGRYILAGIVVVSAFLNLLALTGPLFMLQIYDRVLPSGSVPTLVMLSVLAAALFAFYATLDLLRRRVLVRLGVWLDAALGPLAYRAIVGAPLLVSRDGAKLEPLRDLDAVRSFVSGPGPGVLLDLPWVPLYLGIIHLFHPWLALLALAGMAALVVVMLATELLSRETSRQSGAFAIERQQITETSRRNAETLSALGMVQRYERRWREANDRHMASQRRVSDVVGGLGAVSRALRMALQSAVLGLGAYLVIHQEATAGLIVAASILTGRALAPLDLAIPNWKGWMAARQSWANLTDMLDARPATAAPVELRRPCQSLSVEQVDIVPPGSTRCVVQEASFSLEKGEGLGIVGPSASGKSSLARAIVGAWPPAKGTVRLDGAALDQWTPETLGRHVGYLPQAIELLPGTVGQNIARFEAEADSEAIIRAAMAAGVHDLVVGLPDGYQTLVGPYGAGLSAGQQQRLALARALYGDPFLVVLDEPNSNLDAEGDQALTRAIMGVRRRDGIVIVIAHHPSALAGIDRILVMVQGRIKRLGRKEEILKAAPKAASAGAGLRIVSEAAGAPS